MRQVSFSDALYRLEVTYLAGPPGRIKNFGR